MPETSELSPRRSPDGKESKYFCLFVNVGEQFIIIRLVVFSCIHYSVLAILVSRWKQFHDNNFLYNLDSFILFRITYYLG